MKNILIIDGAENCVYDIYAISDEDFEVIFPNNYDIEFIEDLLRRLDKEKSSRLFENLWKHRVKKKDVKGIHGTLFYDLLHKKGYYPTKRDEEACNLHGELIRPKSSN